MFEYLCSEDFVLLWYEFSPTFALVYFVLGLMTLWWSARMYGWHLFRDHYLAVSEIMLWPVIFVVNASILAGHWFFGLREAPQIVQSRNIPEPDPVPVTRMYNFE